jgi:hypothetical protein
MKRINCLIIIVTLLLSFLSCKKKDEVGDFVVPEDDLREISVNEFDDLNPTDFAYLYKNIFKPNCSTSGCHDGGEFEPDFRTLYSSYNSLVFEPVKTNDQNGTFTYRVKPGDAVLSLLHERLTVDIPSLSGKMPLAPQSNRTEWVDNKDQYILYIKNWINNGALDIYNNAPTLDNPTPQAIGIKAFPQNQTTGAFSRGTGAGVQPILVPISQGIVDIWFAFNDDLTSSSNLAYNKAKVSTNIHDFENSSEQNLTIQAPIQAQDFTGNTANYTHKLTLDLSSYQVNHHLSIRVLVQDEHHTSPTEMPNDGSASNFIQFFTIKLI